MVSEESKIAMAFMKKCRGQNRIRQERYLSKPANREKVRIRRKVKYNHLKI